MRNTTVILIICSTCVLLIAQMIIRSKQEGNLLVLTVATEQTASLEIFRRSAEINGIPLKILGLTEDWWLEEVQQKLWILKKELELHKGSDKIILFADAYDVLFTGGVKSILDKFRQFNSRVLFSADENCYLNRSLCSQYPTVGRGKQFLSPGVFIGYAAELFRLLDGSLYPLTDNEQLHFTRIYVNESLRRQLRIRIDHECELFQTFDGGRNNVQLRYKDDGLGLINTDYLTKPVIVHTPGHCKLLGMLLTDFIPKIGTSEMSLSIMDYPRVIVAVTVGRLRTTSPHFFTELLHLDYPKYKIHLILYSQVKHMEETLETFARDYARDFGAFRLIFHYETKRTVVSFHDLQMKRCITARCSHYLKVDSATRLDDPAMLRMLIERNPAALAPMLHGRDKDAPKFFEFSYANGRCLNSFQVIGNNHVVKVGLF